MITLDQLTQSLPANLKSSATQAMADTINNITADPLVAQAIRDNYISYTGVLKDGKFRTEDYISAVAYVSFKLMGDSNKEAWCKTFPQRYTTLVGRGATDKEISAHVSAYNRGQLVNKILEQSMVPTWVLNQDVFQRAINTQAELMVSAQSEKVRSDAANSLLTHLKKPDAVKGEVPLDIPESSGMNEMRKVIADLAASQRKLIEGGAGIKSITDSRIIENEA